MPRQRRRRQEATTAQVRHPLLAAGSCLVVWLFVARAFSSRKLHLTQLTASPAILLAACSACGHPAGRLRGRRRRRGAPPLPQQAGRAVAAANVPRRAHHASGTRPPRAWHPCL